MKIKKSYINLSLLLLILSLIVVNTSFHWFNAQYFTGLMLKNNTSNYSQDDIQASNSYQLVDPINITSWNNWTDYSFITGNGTDLNPFIIENIEIIGTGVKTMQSGNRTLLNYTYTGIYIDTNGSFIIRNCKISHTSIGIHLSFNIPPGVYHILNTEISDCSIGMYSRWFHVVVNISNCYIHNCNWISITANLDINDYLDYGGIGIWVRSDGGFIEDCRIEDCSIGMMAGRVPNPRNNELINCGIVPDYVVMYTTNYDSSNTVNGKPIGIFWGLNNLTFSNASLYGQLIFAACDNLTLLDVHITKPCSIGIQLVSVTLNQTTHLNNIIIENQKLGFYIQGRDIFGHNLYAKNCEAGFYFVNIRDSSFTKIMTDNTDIPIYSMGLIDNQSIEIEQSTEFYLVDASAYYWDKLQVVYSNTSYNVSMSYIPELGFRGYVTQFDDVNNYQVTLSAAPPVPSPPEMRANITVISVPRYSRPAVEPPPGIPGFNIVALLGICSFITLIVIIKNRGRIKP
jgi:hypothetical protein